jgi:hypothetical protein
LFGGGDRLPHGRVDVVLRVVDRYLSEEAKLRGLQSGTQTIHPRDLPPMNALFGSAPLGLAAWTEAALTALLVYPVVWMDKWRQMPPLEAQAEREGWIDGGERELPRSC